MSWDRILWRRSGFANKVISVISPSKLGNCSYEVRKYGQSCDRLATGLALLDGGWIAFHSDLLRELDAGLLEFSMELEEAGGMMFEEWSHRLHRAGYRLAACQTVSLLMDDDKSVSRGHVGEASLYLTGLYGFDPLAELEEDHVFFGVPVSSLAEAELAQTSIFSELAVMT